MFLDEKEKKLSFEKNYSSKNYIHSIDDESLNFEKDLDANLNAFNISNIKKERKFLSILTLDF